MTLRREDIPMEKEYHKGHDLNMADLGLSLEELRRQPLELFAREGARMVLTVALEEEVTEYLERKRYERGQGNHRGYRNGHRDRHVACGAGEIQVAMPGYRIVKKPSAPSYLGLGNAAVRH